MTFIPVPYSVSGTAAVDAINAALFAIDAGQGPTAATAAAILAELRQAEGAVAGKLDSATFEAYEAGANGYFATQGALAEGLAGKADAAALTKLADAVAYRGDTASLRDAIIALRQTGPLHDRPGDAPLFFTTDLVSGISGVPSGATAIVGPNGRALRIVGSAVLAPSALCAIEPGRTYKVRAVVRRARDPADPAGDAIRLAVAWYGADCNILPLAPQDLGTINLLVAGGRTVIAALIALSPSAPGVVAAPTGAAYCRPVVLTFGPDGATDVEVISAVDVTDPFDLSI